MCKYGLETKICAEFVDELIKTYILKKNIKF